MKVLLDLNGWQKIEDIPSHISCRGYIDVGIYPPINTMVKTAGAKVMPLNAVVARFYYCGKERNNLPIFKYQA